MPNYKKYFITSQHKKCLINKSSQLESINKIILYNMRVATVRCIVKSQDKKDVLLCKCKKGGHCFLPGGGVKFQELAEEAIIREFKEEMGLNPEQIKINKFIGITENMFDDAHGIDVVFDVDITEKNVKSQEADKIDFIWCSIDSLDSIDIRPTPVKNMIKDYKNNHIISITCDRNKLQSESKKG